MRQEGPVVRSTCLFEMPQFIREATLGPYKQIKILIKLTKSG